MYKNILLEISKQFLIMPTLLYNNRFFEQIDYSYLDKGAFISNPYMGMPKPWYRDDIAGNVMEKFLNKKTGRIKI